MFTSIIAVATVLASALLGTVAALPKVSVVGSKFFTDDGNQFFLKGQSVVAKEKASMTY